MDDQKNSEQNDTVNTDSLNDEFNTSEVPEHTEPVQPADTQESPVAPQPVVVTKRRFSFNRKTVIAILVASVVIIGGVIAFLMQGSDSTTNKNSQQQTNQDETVKKFGVAVGLAEGKVEYAEAGAEGYVALETTTELSEGMRVRTGGDGRVVLLIDDGSAVRLSYSSEIELSSLLTDSVSIENISGEIYSRVAASEARKYSVTVGEDSFVAKGTAYRTFNKETKKGVEVFHSSVEAEDKDTTITEGSAFLTLSEQKEKENIISQIDIEALKSDEFIKWNADQDKKSTDFADKLGVLVDLDKVPEAPAPVAPKPKATAGIVLKGSQSEYSAVFSWTVTGVDVSKGFKLVGSKKTSTPTYPDNSIAYIEAGKTSYSHYAGDGNTINYRLCAYRDGSCESYSNVVTVTTTAKSKPVVEAGAVNASLAGNVVSWTFAGTAPNGFKIVIGTSTGPTYDNNIKKLYTADTTISMPDEYLTSGTTYYVKVCKYTDGGCQDYSNEVTYVKP